MSENKQEVTISMGAAAGAFRVEFADGSRDISEAVVIELGGGDIFQQIAPALKTKTFAEFSEFVQNLRVKREVNNFQQNLVRNHFGGFAAVNNRFRT